MLSASLAIFLSSESMQQWAIPMVVFTPPFNEQLFSRIERLELTRTTQHLIAPWTGQHKVGGLVTAPGTSCNKVVGCSRTVRRVVLQQIEAAVATIPFIATEHFLPDTCVNVHLAPDELMFAVMTHTIRATRAAPFASPPRFRDRWGATIILSGRTTIMMAGGEESKAA